MTEEEAERRGFNDGLRTAVTLLESYAAERFLAGKDDEATRLREKVKQLKALATPSKVR